MRPVLVILVVGLTPRLLGAQTPNINRLVNNGKLSHLETIFPAVTCSVQASFVTGEKPSSHGIVANGWYCRDMAEVYMWKQSNHLVAGEKIWQQAKSRDSNFSCAKMFWWYNMYSSVDISATPRPIYLADGRKFPDHYTFPANLHDKLDAEFGRFPLFKFWGPGADIISSRWIANASKYVIENYRPTLTLCYLPHLDYNLQRIGPDTDSAIIQSDLGLVDELCADLIHTAENYDMDVVITSEYGIMPVDHAIHINIALRQAGLLKVRKEFSSENLDPGASHAFALADHQVAHIYVRQTKLLGKVKALLESLTGVEQVLDKQQMQELGLNHARSGDLIAIANKNSWFSYYFWLDEKRAPAYARTVDIHRKPGYDPAELFIDPKIKWPSLKIARKLLAKRIGMNTLLDLIPIDGSNLVKGSHGRITDDPADGPLIISTRSDLLQYDTVKATDFKDIVLQHIFN